MRAGIRYLILTFMVIVSTTNNAQKKKFTISGYIEDSTSAERLIGATIYERGLKAGTTSNQYGFFSLTLPSDTLTILVSFIGYETLQLKIKLTGDEARKIQLVPTVFQLQAFEVSGRRIERIEMRTQMSEVNLPVAAVKVLPSILGETDILKIVQLLPGVKTGAEAMSGFYVRGGNPEQNLILLDEAPVYNVSHLFGFFSIFNSDAVKNVNLIKGGFPARYGSRLSSVLDISLKEGNMKEMQGLASIGLIASRFTLEGPVITDRTSFIFSGRRTYLDLLTRPFMKDDDFAGYYFYDINAKINHVFSHDDRVYASFYLGRDLLYVREEKNDIFNFDLNWGNLTATLRWNHIFNKKLFFNATAIYTDYDFEINSTTDQNSGYSYHGKYFSGIKDAGIKADFDLSPMPSHYIKFGGSLVYHVFTPDALQIKINSEEKIDTLISPSEKIHAREYAAYLEDDFEISSRLKANLGVRASGFGVPGKFFNSFQPRILFRYLFSEDWAAKASYSTMTQYIHLLSANRIGLPNDLWVPATKRVVPQQSWQAAAGIAHSAGEYDMSIEAYYKIMTDIIEYQQGSSFMVRSSSWEDNVVSGKGKSYGIELLIQKMTGRLNGWIGYTWSKTTKQYQGLNNGKEFPAKYDRRHDIAIVAIYKLSESVDISGDWVYGSGNAITVPTGYFSVNTNYLSPFGYNVASTDKMKLYSSRNAYRMNAYHRLDVSLKYTAGNNIWTFSVYNIYNRKNPYIIYLDEDKENNTAKVRQVSLFPIIPCISYSYIF